MKKKKSCIYSYDLCSTLWYTSCWSCDRKQNKHCRKPVHRQISTDLTLQMLVHGHVILFYKKGYLKKCSCIYCSVCCQLDIMLEGKVVWDELNRSLILHSETFCKFLSLLPFFFFSPMGKRRELCNLSFTFSLPLMMLAFFKAQWQFTTLFVVFNWDLE